MNKTWAIITLLWFLITGILTVWTGWTWEDGGLGPPGCLQCGIGPINILNPIILMVAGAGTIIGAGIGLMRQASGARAG